MGALLGKVPRLARTSATAQESLPPLRLGVRVTVCANAVVYAGSAVDNDVMIGARCKIQSNVYVTAFSVVEDDVFIGPGASMTNDDTMSRHAPGDALRAPTLRRACRIGGGAVLVPGVEVGEEAFVAAGAVVTKDVPPRAFMVGVPARQVREVRDDELLERWR